VLALGATSEFPTRCDPAPCSNRITREWWAAGSPFPTQRKDDVNVARFAAKPRVFAAHLGLVMISSESERRTKSVSYAQVHAGGESLAAHHRPKCSASPTRNRSARKKVNSCGSLKDSFQRITRWSRPGGVATASRGRGEVMTNAFDFAASGAFEGAPVANGSRDAEMHGPTNERREVQTA